MQEILDNCDFVACLGIQTTQRKDIGDSKLYERIEQEFEDDSISDLQATISKSEKEGRYVFSRIIEIDWCVYNLKESKVEADQTVLVIPGNGNQSINFEEQESLEEFQNRTGLNWNRIHKDGMELKDALVKVS